MNEDNHHETAYIETHVMVAFFSRRTAAHFLQNGDFYCSLSVCLSVDTNLRLSIILIDFNLCTQRRYQRRFNITKNQSTHSIKLCLNMILMPFSVFFFWVMKASMYSLYLQEICEVVDRYFFLDGRLLVKILKRSFICIFCKL